ncbi:MAG: oxidoreductase [bacterium]|nr:oxidoreductase [bacterium]
MTKGLLIDYTWCTGCHACETACKRELGLPREQFGIKLAEYIWPMDEGKDFAHTDNWQYTYFPMPLDACDLCEERTAKGKLPSCVHHCQANCLFYGEIEDLMERFLEHPRQSLFHL